ncbi:MAG: hypothetical protein QGD96_06285, partial [Anaerolineae bacterium]|nr:hypothetical protein [Anaerolineae bacterium]
AARVAGDLSWEDYCTYFGDGPCSSEIETDRAKEDFFMDTIALAQVVMEPITLDATRGDDIVVSYFVVDTDRTIVRYPIKPIQHSLNDIQESKISDADIRAQLDPCGPARGILLVEIFYNYSHRLKLPVFSAIVPDPIPVYTYAIMPMHKVQPLEPEPVPEDCLEEEA